MTTICSQSIMNLFCLFTQNVPIAVFFASLFLSGFSPQTQKIFHKKKRRGKGKKRIMMPSIWENRKKNKNFPKTDIKMHLTRFFNQQKYFSAVGYCYQLKMKSKSKPYEFVVLVSSTFLFVGSFLFLVFFSSSSKLPSVDWIRKKNLAKLWRVVTSSLFYSFSLVIKHTHSKQYNTKVKKLWQQYNLDSSELLICWKFQCFVREIVAYRYLSKANSGFMPCRMNKMNDLKSFSMLIV